MTGLLGEVDLPAPIGDRWFEDYVPGSVFEFGYARLRQTEIVAFARDYDPQSIHAPGVVGDGAVRRVDRQRCAYDRRLHASLRRSLHLPGGQPGLARAR